MVSEGRVDRNGVASTKKISTREGGNVAMMQRRRLLIATVELVYERGVRMLSVARICERAGLSRRTFYDLFKEREDCLLATFEDAVERAGYVVEQAVLGQGSWLERIRAGLLALLSLLDYEPAIGRLLVVEALVAGPRTLEARSRALARMIAVVDEGRAQARASRSPPPLTAEGVVGAVFSVIHARLLAGPSIAMAGAHVGESQPPPLAELVGPLMAMIVQPYLGSSIAGRELERPATPAVRSMPRLPSDPFKDLPIRITYRTARVLSSISDSPGASSKQIGAASGISDDGQVSRLLARLHGHGLIKDGGIGPTQGMARAWSLTPRGEGVLQAIGQA